MPHTTRVEQRRCHCYIPLQVQKKSIMITIQIAIIEPTNTCQETWVYHIGANLWVDMISESASINVIIGTAATCTSVI